MLRLKNITAILHQQWLALHLLAGENSVELLTTLTDAFLVARVDDINEAVYLTVVIAPNRAYILTAAEVEQGDVVVGEAELVAAEADCRDDQRRRGWSEVDRKNARCEFSKTV